jgi:hypothetical protein
MDKLSEPLQLSKYVIFYIRQHNLFLKKKLIYTI